MDIYTQNFCYNICFVRKIYRLTQKEMANIVGISIHTLRKIEKRNPSVRVNATMLSNLCDYFNISADCMLGERIEASHVETGGKNEKN